MRTSVFMQVMGASALKMMGSGENGGFCGQSTASAGAYPAKLLNTSVEASAVPSSNDFRLALPTNRTTRVSVSRTWFESLVRRKLRADGMPRRLTRPTLPHPVCGARGMVRTPFS